MGNEVDRVVDEREEELGKEIDTLKEALDQATKDMAGAMAAIIMGAPMSAHEKLCKNYDRFRTLAINSPGTSAAND